MGGSPCDPDEVRAAFNLVALDQDRPAACPTYVSIAPSFLSHPVIRDSKLNSIKFRVCCPQICIRNV